MTLLSRAAGWLIAAAGSAVCLFFLSVGGPALFALAAGKQDELSGGDLTALVVVSVIFGAIGAIIARAGVRMARASASESRQSGASLLIGILLMAGVPWLALRFDLDLKTVKWIASGVFGALWLVFAAANASYAWLAWVKKVERPPSMIPLAGAFFGLMAIVGSAITPVELKWTLAFLAVLLDAGTSTMLGGLAILGVTLAARTLRKAR